ncbi:MAG: site-specific integrase [Devosia nanyangense]|uniref:Site-specific integrase n=1 Tax=Devosia nanyangense TaxID=1228055 RepID=A0A933NYB4_9HYPH|nr:site-specific integrase [Devosia nanyangense]
MPLKLVDPRPGKTPNYGIRGTYLGVGIDRTAGTPDRAKARKVLAQIRDDIERGAFAPRAALSFAAAALSYIRAGGEATFMTPLNDRFGDTALVDIDQASIDDAAHALYPEATPATRNRQVYTPISAVLKHANFDFKLKRPKGAQGQVRVDWIWPEEASVLFDAAAEVDKEFRAFLVLLTYCGPRLSEALKIQVDDIRIAEAFAFIGTTKNGEPRPVHLPPTVVAELANHPRGLDRPGETLFRFRKNGFLYELMALTRKKAKLTRHVTFHTLRHTWATWMRRYAGLDAKGLVATGAWRDAKSADRYTHVVISEEAQRSDLLPAPIRGKSVDSGKS